MVLVYYTFNDFEQQDFEIYPNGKLKLTDILDKSQYKFIEEKDELKHYQLITVKELINKLKLEAGRE